MSKCHPTHHYACDCREAEFAALREHVATLEGGIREIAGRSMNYHKPRYEISDELYALLDASHDQDDGQERDR